MGFLDELLTSTRERVDRARRARPLDALRVALAEAPEVRPFHSALRGEELAFVAEIKRATPSAGVLDAGLDAAALARAYRDGGANAISVLTEPHFFRGSLEDLLASRSAGLPVLRKDFVVDEYQVYEARANGADAVLLIVRILDERLPVLLRLVRDLGMDALVEVFDHRDVERALEAGADLVGVNNRDLETFEVDPGRTADLARSILPAATLVALSGVSTRRDVASLAGCGADAVLIGTSLVTAEDPAARLRELRAA